MDTADVVIPEKLFFKIGEVSDITETQSHVLRYWESEFPMLAPQKNRAGQHTYRKRDVEMVLRIKQLLYEDQYTIAGAKKKLHNELRGANKLKVVAPEAPTPPAATIESRPVPTTASVAAPSSPANFAAGPLPPAHRPNYEMRAATDSAAVLSEDKRAALRRLQGQLREVLTLLRSSPPGRK